MSDTARALVPIDPNTVEPHLKELVARFGARLFDNDPPKTEWAYDPRNWFWIHRDGSVFSSARISTVAPGEPDYRDFLASGRLPTAYPTDEAGAESASELQAAIGRGGGFASLEAYVAARRYALEIAGVAVKIGGAPVAVSTAREMAPTLRATLTDIREKIRKDGDVLKVFADGIPRAATNAEARAAATAGLQHIQAAFNLEGALAGQIAAGTLTDKAGVDAAFAAAIEAETGSA